MQFNLKRVDGTPVKFDLYARSDKVNGDVLISVRMQSHIILNNSRKMTCAEKVVS
jgi:hypothetical protein